MGLTREVFEDECLCDVVDVTVEGGVGLVLEPGHLLRDHLAIPLHRHRDPVTMATHHKHTINKHTNTLDTIQCTQRNMQMNVEIIIFIENNTIYLLLYPLS